MLNRIRRWILCGTVAGATMFASSCGMQTRDALFEAGTDFINALADDLLLTLSGQNDN